eukprot:2175-Heterococcus_DN1.PRE.3
MRSDAFHSSMHSTKTTGATVSAHMRLLAAILQSGTQVETEYFDIAEQLRASSRRVQLKLRLLLRSVSGYTCHIQHALIQTSTTSEAHYILRLLQLHANNNTYTIALQ